MTKLHESGRDVASPATVTMRPCTLIALSPVLTATWARMIQITRDLERQSGTLNAYRGTIGSIEICPRSHAINDIGDLLRRHRQRLPCILLRRDDHRLCLIYSRAYGYRAFFYVWVDGSNKSTSVRKMLNGVASIGMDRALHCNSGNSHLSGSNR